MSVSFSLRKPELQVEVLDAGDGATGMLSVQDQVAMVEVELAKGEARTVF